MPAGERPSPFVPVLLAWLVPGAGHFRLGRPWPAVFVAGAVIPLFALGMLLAGWENVSPDRHPWYFATQVWAGLPTAAAWLATTNVELTEPLPYGRVGVLYSAVAGLLNLVAIADCWARCKRGDPEELERTLRASAEEKADEGLPGLAAHDLVAGPEAREDADA